MPDDLRTTLERHGQGHLLDGVEVLDDRTRGRLLERLATVDWAELAAPVAAPAATVVEPPEVVTLAERELRGEALAALGDSALRAGRVALLVVAGGQSTRLGLAGPKGCFPIAPLSGKTIYQLQAEKVVALSRRIGRPVPLLVMTSPATDADTRAAFAEHHRFGLAEHQVRFLVQGTVPSVDREGRALLAAPGVLFESPDGHGGVFTALVASGELDRLRAERIAHLVYFQVDNLLARLDDPVLVGLADERRADVVSKVLRKRDPDEKVGNLVRSGGRDRVVEYTELSPEQTRARSADGELVYRWASPALHAWSVEFLGRLAERGYRPPLHRSAKPLRAWQDGELRDVDGWKLERFVFDLIPEAERSVALEIRREEEFAPVKNASGADSPATAIELTERLFAQWLEAAGVRVALPDGAHLEISPLYAATREQLQTRWDGRLDEVAGDLYLEDGLTLGLPENARA